jgi:RNA polymerase sigma-70 factor, ECF subfamily
MWRQKVPNLINFSNNLLPFTGDSVSTSGQVTALLEKTRGGDSQAESQLMELIYDELHRLAARYLRSERPNHTLEPTALVNEVYLALVDKKDRQWLNRSHFLAASAQLMRRILVDYGRMRYAAKRGGGSAPLPLDEALLFSAEDPGAFLDLDRALDRLALLDARQSRIVELRFFGGLTDNEVAEYMGISGRTVKREWSMARAWLHGQLDQSPEPRAPGAASA